MSASTSTVVTPSCRCTTRASVSPLPSNPSASAGSTVHAMWRPIRKRAWPCDRAGDRRGSRRPWGLAAIDRDAFRGAATARVIRVALSARCSRRVVHTNVYARTHALLAGRGSPQVVFGGSNMGRPAWTSQRRPRAFWLMSSVAIALLMCAPMLAGAGPVRVDAEQDSNQSPVFETLYDPLMRNPDVWNQ